MIWAKGGARRPRPWEAAAPPFVAHRTLRHLLERGRLYMRKQLLGVTEPAVASISTCELDPSRCTPIAFFPFRTTTLQMSQMQREPMYFAAGGMRAGSSATLWRAVFLCFIRDCLVSTPTTKAGRSPVVRTSIHAARLGAAHAPLIRGRRHAIPPWARAWCDNHASRRNRAVGE